ncbi:hypothetical protein IKP94_03020 [Candidatus Saccharibacteria bacterium]|nr:hypothetical protein [Candidatus Saccharibacteria bacterium]
MAVPASAATETGLSGNTKIPIAREVHGVSNPVTATFCYRLVPDENNPAEILGLPYYNFSMYDAVPDEHHSALVEKYLNLSSLRFTKVGDYIIHVREDYSDDPVNYPIDDFSEYKILISVRNQVTDTAPTGELVATLVDQVVDVRGDKVGGMTFSSGANRVSISLTKQLSGNAANTDEYFKFLVNFNNAKAGDVFTISGQDETVTYDGNVIVAPTRFVVGEENYVYLKGGQTIEIGKDSESNNELPIGLTYTITEVAAEDYNTYIDDSKIEGKVSASKTTTDLSSTTDDPSLQNATIFENVKNAAVMTGVSSIILPLIGLMLIGLVSTCTYMAISRKK